MLSAMQLYTQCSIRCICHMAGSFQLRDDAFILLKNNNLHVDCSHTPGAYANFVLAIWRHRDILTHRVIHSPRRALPEVMRISHLSCIFDSALRSGVQVPVCKSQLLRALSESALRRLQ
ncbi:MAG: hypothetical protein P4L92_09245 [Rudaea sp.]|nr:hypothetical protein [Rudaea sp.]